MPKAIFNPKVKDRNPTIKFTHKKSTTPKSSARNLRFRRINSTLKYTIILDAIQRII
ncbi:MAG: hypothetical protein KAH07_04435 [Flavobacteriaceae bacterium]|nr:hypothetical protein [Flavobacteriaceae bacterium]